MKTYHYYITPSSKLPQIVGTLALLLFADIAYLLLSMPSYTQYIDYWGLLVAGFLLAIICFGFARKHPRLLTVPTGIIGLIACFSQTLLHGMEIILFFLLLILLWLRLPKWCGILFRILGVCTTCVGTYAAWQPVAERIERLSQTGNATADYIVPYIIRTLGGNVLCLLTMLLLLFALRPHVLPGWMDEADNYDKIWE